VKITNIKFHGNPFIISQVDKNGTDRQRKGCTIGLNFANFRYEHASMYWGMYTPCGKCSAVPGSPPKAQSGEVSTFFKRRYGTSGITTDPEKLKAVRESPTPKNKHEIRSFLGLCTYYGRFTSGSVNVAKPLTKLTEEKQAFQWTPEVDATDLEANPEEKEAVAEQQEVPNEEAALEDEY
jgi:hypothetical protein